MEQVREVPLEQHDDLTINIVRRLGGDLDARAQGGETSGALDQEVMLIGLAAGDEGAGEGWHRGATHEKQRAGASATEHLVQHNRRKQELARIHRFIDMGEFGKQVVRFEWRTWKRIIQTSWARRLTNVKGPHQAVLDSIYHKDDRSRDDWSLIVGKKEPARPVVTERPNTRTQLENEYLVGVLQQNRFYTVPPAAATVGGDGAGAAVQEHPVFEVVNIRGSHSRPHVMPTFRSADDPALVASLALEIQPMVRQVTEGEVDQGNLEGAVVRAEADAYWARALDVASFQNFAYHAQTWGATEPVPEQPGCVQLVGLEKAKTHHALTDDACPTICIVHYLQSHLKWRPVKHLVVHTLENQPDLLFDDRESMRMKKYYLCCVYLTKCLALTSSMPSQQPVTYYKCLLAGLAVEPHQTDKFYHDVFNRHCKAKGKAPLPLPAPDPVPPLRYDDDDDAVMVGVDTPPGRT